MTALLIILIIVGAIVMVACGTLATRLWKGQSLHLVAVPVTKKKRTYFTEANERSAQRVSWVCVALFGVLLTALMLAMSSLTDNQAFMHLANLLNIGMLVVFAAVVVWAAWAQYRANGGRLSFDKSADRRYLLCLIAAIAVSTVFSTVMAML
ncbi:hypothetical protein GMI69_10430 [Eggerthellaceae bacterium zg-887]|uniref:hypothetical protein n=1 Tax=Xiamenia xianingshaonis TaxID=2682776 RepID=UPI00140B0A3B|nr:hypothetical protein [Xiamenia xianingshaonis]NHM17048.1 hypothetical protein [Xiamenia xianingshaonis]